MDRNFDSGFIVFCPVKSLSARRAWIEIRSIVYNSASGWVALRKESVDRNVYASNRAAERALSLSARRAWIEIVLLAISLRQLAVALRKESVDRNFVRLVRHRLYCVALRKESVDRNSNPATMRSVIGVALRKESVDRNLFIALGVYVLIESLSARRAWIEILLARVQL